MTDNPLSDYLMRSMHKMLYEHMELSLIGHESDADILAAVRSQHKLLVNAILARDPKTAGTLARGHIEFVRVRLNHLMPNSA